MGNFSTVLANELLDHLFGKGDYTPPTIYVALSTAAPGDTGSTIAEPSGGSYARKVTAASDWAAASSRATSNAADIEFAEATDSWGTVTHFALFDADEDGTFLGWGQLTSSKTISSGDAARFKTGELDVSYAASA
jgi:hypothetical protein